MRFLSHNVLIRLRELLAETRQNVALVEIYV